MAASAVQRIRIHRLAIPLRRAVRHAAHQRRVSEPVVVAVELIGGVTGYGETLPRTYVTGETCDSVVAAIGQVFAPHLLTMRPSSLAEALEAIDGLPEENDQGVRIIAARAAVEMALLDAYSRFFDRPLSELAGWLELPRFGPPGSRSRIRYSGVLAADSPAGTLKTLRLMWWYGLRYFKLKVGNADDDARMAAVVRYLRRPLAGKACTLRIDANGCWSLEDAAAALNRWVDVPLEAVEQPLSPRSDGDLPALKNRTKVALMHDESLVTEEDARRLLAAGVADGFNIRISKCGGFVPALRLAALARRQGVVVQLGCMVGETSILAAAGVRFLENVPGVRFAEGCFGRRLLSADLVTGRTIQFGYGGRCPSLAPMGWGIDVDERRLAALTSEHPINIDL